MRTTLASRGRGRGRGREAGQRGAAPGAHQHGEAAGVTAARPGQAGDKPADGNRGAIQGDARGARTDAMPGSPLSSAMAWALGSFGGRPGPGRTPVVRVHRGALGRMRWPQAGPVPVSCSLAPAPASRARTPPMAGSWLASSGSGGEPGSGSGCGGRPSASQRSRLGQAGDDAVGAARAGRESRSRTPGSRAMHSSNRARPVRTLPSSPP